jgi:AcrR family transcriptional regulator
MSGIASERFPRRDPPARRETRKARTRAAILLACRAFMRAGRFQPPLEACCEQAGRSSRAAYRAFGSVEALLLEAADDQPTRAAIVERVLGCERTALSAETLDRLVRALVTGAG